MVGLRSACASLAKRSAPKEAPSTHEQHFRECRERPTSLDARKEGEEEGGTCGNFHNKTDEVPRQTSMPHISPLSPARAPPVSILLERPDPFPTPSHHLARPTKRANRLVTEGGEALGDGRSLGGGLEGSNLGLGVGGLALVEGSGLDLALLLEAVDDVAVRPSDLVRETLRVKRRVERNVEEWVEVKGRVGEGKREKEQGKERKLSASSRQGPTTRS